MAEQKDRRLRTGFDNRSGNTTVIQAVLKHALAFANTDLLPFGAIYALFRVAIWPRAPDFVLGGRPGFRRFWFRLGRKWRRPAPVETAAKVPR